MSDKTNDIVFEIINDMFWLSYILELKRLVEDYNKKEILSLFLLFFSSIFCGETLKSGYGSMENNKNVTKKEIIDFRNNNLKNCFKITSDTTKSVVGEMGIDLEKYIFDIVLYMSGSTLVDVNVRNWNYDKEDKYKLLECVIATPNAWIDKLMPNEYGTMIQLMQEPMKMHIDRINNFTIEKKQYSSYKLFSKSIISNDDKLYILQRYGIIQIVLFIDSIFKEDISLHFRQVNIESKKFITKCKAILICMFYEDKIKNKSIKVLDEIFELNKKSIPNEFYKWNRTIRNNIHYNECSILKKEKIVLVQKYQDVYLKNILNVFNDKISLSFGTGYKFGLWAAKALG